MKDVDTTTVPIDELWARLDRLEAAELRKLATAVVEAWETEPEAPKMYTSEQLDHALEELGAHIRNGGTNG